MNKEGVLVDRQRFPITDTEGMMNFILENAREVNKRIVVQGVVDNDFIYKIQLDVVIAPYSALSQTEQVHECNSEREKQLKKLQPKTRLIKVNGAFKRVPIDYEREDISASTES